MTAHDEQWRFLNSGAHSGAFNMQFDIDTAVNVQRGIVPQTIRVYAWNPWAISLGYNQHQEDIDRERAYADGIDVVRRPTGGRAILHAREVTYSVAMFSEGRNTNGIYRIISRALVRGLKKVCPRIDFETSQPNLSRLYRKTESIPCFTTSARYEIQIDGRKVVGSAQRRYVVPGYPEVVLQHGSILIGDDHKNITRYIRNADEGQIAKMNNDFASKTLSLEEALQRQVFYDEIVECIQTGFEEEWSMEFSHHVAEQV